MRGGGGGKGCGYPREGVGVGKELSAEGRVCSMYMVTHEVASVTPFIYSYIHGGVEVAPTVTIPLREGYCKR